jgi:hypothetical protein
MSRKDQYNVTVSVTRDGTTRNLGTFDKLTGGDVDSDDVKYRPGNMADQISLGSYRTVNNITASRLLDLKRDLAGSPGNLAWLMNGVGSADVVVTKQSLDVNKNPFGSPIVYRGKLKAVTPPEVDSESTDAALFEIEITTDGTLS